MIGCVCKVTKFLPNTNKKSKNKHFPSAKPSASEVPHPIAHPPMPLPTLKTDPFGAKKPPFLVTRLIVNNITKFTTKNITN